MLDQVAFRHRGLTTRTCHFVVNCFVMRNQVQTRILMDKSCTLSHQEVFVEFPSTDEPIVYAESCILIDHNS